MLHPSSSSSYASEGFHLPLPGLASGLLVSTSIMYNSLGCSGDSLGKTVDDHMRSTLTFNNKQCVFASQNIDYGQPIACISYPYNDSGSGGIWAAYGSSTVLHSQIAGGGTSTTTRVPLPLELAADGPIYVNPKQYHGILRRRQLRAKLEAQNKHFKTRKPYLHESRHLHAMKRVRGSGGRFLNTKQQQQFRTASTKATTDGANSSGSIHLRLGGGAAGDRTTTVSKTMASQENSIRVAASAPAFTVAPPVVHKNGAFFQHHGQHLSFSSHFSQPGTQGGVGGAMHNGTSRGFPLCNEQRLRTVAGDLDF